MAGIKYKSMRDPALPGYWERANTRGLLGALAGPTPAEENIANAYRNFRQGIPASVTNAGPLESGYVPLEQGAKLPAQQPGDVNSLLQGLIG
jgi:hypothetical protein